MESQSNRQIKVRPVSQRQGARQANVVQRPTYVAPRMVSYTDQELLDQLGPALAGGMGGS